jgi:hypothetical protein
MDMSTDTSRWSTTIDMLTMSTISTDMVKNPTATNTHMRRCCIATLTTRIFITAIAISRNSGTRDPISRKWLVRSA